jgi:D-threo-aldose 1-dehydrogenase
MKQVSLPRSSKKTSQLGFGCAFWSSIGEPEAARMLDAAYDAGIRHFDVAPYYLNGTAERYVGKLLSKYKDISVTTKFGLLPASAQAFHARLMRLLLKPLFRSIRSGANVPFRAKISAISKRKARFSVDEMQASLNRSSILLNRPFIDIFLLHEPDETDFDNQSFLNSIRENVVQGRVGAIGIGAPSNLALEIVKKHGLIWDVMQYDWTPFSGSPLFPDTFQILYWIFVRNFGETHQRFLRNDDLVRHWSDRVGIDLYRPDSLRNLLLKSALLANEKGIVLVYSSNIDHIHENVMVAENASLDRSAKMFLDLAKAASLEHVGL